VDGSAYSDVVLNMWCGKEGLGDKSLGAVTAMASVADRFGITEVGAAHEDAIVRHLAVVVCVDVLMGSARLRPVCWRRSGSTRRGGGVDGGIHAPQCGWTRTRKRGRWESSGRRQAEYKQGGDCA
jgi:hypothetical protein